MNEILSFFKEIFMLKENNSLKVGLSGYKSSQTPVEKPQKKSMAPKELKISELMRKGSY